ncbi:MAG: peptidylprolyl isomerase [Planctomycetota bacterium]
MASRPLAILLLLVALPAAAQDPLPADVAAMHPEGKWKVRKADLYRYLAKYESGQSNALAVLPEYMKLRLVEDEARRRKISVSEEDVDRKLEQIDAAARAAGQPGLKELTEHYEMRDKELRRKARQWVLQERVARAILKEKDPARKDEPLSDDSVIFVIDTLYKDAKKETEGLPDGIVARIRGIDITEYEYGRALSIELPSTEVLRALRGLILAEEVVLLLGDRNPPAPEEIAEQRRWFLEMEKSRIRRSIQNAPEDITDETVEQVLKQRGLSLELVLGNPAFLAQARAVGHFQKALTEEDLLRYYEEHKGQYGDKLRVARILVGARGQKIPGVGAPIRTLAKGKEDSDALYEQLKAGQDFFKLAREKSEDPDVLRKGGGIVPFWITSDMPGYRDTFEQAAKLKEDAISQPFYSEGRGYVIVKLLGREPAPEYARLKDAVRSDAARYRYELWRNERTTKARVNTALFDDK